MTRRRRPLRDQIRRALWIAATPLTYPAKYKDRETWEREGELTFDPRDPRVDPNDSEVSR